MAGDDTAEASALARARRLVGDDPPAQRRVWRLQRCGWVVMALVVTASGVGLFGAGGPLAGRSAGGSAPGLEVSYEPVVRQSRSTGWIILLPRGADTLVLADPAIDRFEPRRVVPRPILERRVAGGLALVFDTAEGAALPVRLSLTPVTPGWHAVRLAAGGSAATLRIATLP